MPETHSAAAVKREALELMNDDLRISARQAADFIESMCASVEEAIENGRRVALFGLVTITPKFVTAKPKRQGVDPRTGEPVTYPPKAASVGVRAAPAKRVKDALPTTASAAGKSLKAEAIARQEAAQQRREAREAEEAKAQRKADREAKAGAAKKKTAKK